MFLQQGIPNKREFRLQLFSISSFSSVFPFMTFFLPPDRISLSFDGQLTIAGGYLTKSEMIISPALAKRPAALQRVCKCQLCTG